MAGYSSTPLWRKLGYKTGVPAFADNAPTGYANLLELPADVPVTWLARPAKGVGFVHVFSRDAAELRKKLAAYRRQIAPDGVV